MKKYMPTVILAVMLLCSIAWGTSLTTQQILNNAYDSTTGTLSLSISQGTWKDTTALTNAVTYPAKLQHETSGTPANGIGVGLEFIQKTSASNNETGAYINATVTDATAGSEDFEINFGTMAAGAAAADKLTMGSTGIVTMTGGATLDNSTSATNLNITETTVTVTGNFVTTGSVDITGSAGLILENDETITNAVDGTLLLTAPVVNVSAAFVPEFETSDPCGTFPEGAIFYNDTGNFLCYCDQAGDDLKLTDNTTACF